MRRLSTLLLLGAFAAATAQGQMPFEGFEEWDSRNGREEPVGWSLGLGSGPAAEAFRGDRALSVWTWYCSSPGGAVLGDVGERGAYLCDDYEYSCYGDYGIPIAFKPVSLSGYYRYLPGSAMPGTNDSAVVRVLLKRYDSSRGRYDTVALGERSLPPSESYIPFTVSIRDRAPGVLPDSIAMVILSRGGCDCAVAGNCYYLSVDELTLAGASGVSAPSRRSGADAIRIYPNPAREKLRIAWGEDLLHPHRLRIHAISGETIRTIEEVRGSSLEIDGAGLAPGEYLFDLLDDGGRGILRGRFIVE